MGEIERLGKGLRVDDAEALQPLGLHLEDAQLLHVRLRDAREAAHGLGHGGRAHLDAFADEADAERVAGLQAVLRHVHVARLEDAKRQQGSRIEHGGQREDRYALLLAARAQEVEDQQA